MLQNKLCYIIFSSLTAYSYNLCRIFIFPGFYGRFLCALIYFIRLYNCNRLHLNKYFAYKLVHLDKPI